MVLHAPRGTTSMLFCGERSSIILCAGKEATRMFRVEQEEAIRFYCGVSEQVWNHHPVAPGAYACISPVSGRHEDTPESRRVNYVRIPPGTAVIQDSGAFSDGPRQRLSVEEALERQIAHAERFGYAS